MTKLEQLLEQRQNILYTIGQLKELLTSINNDIENNNFLVKCPFCERASNTSDWHEKTKERYGFDIHTIYDIMATGDGAGYICPKCNNGVTLEEEHIQQD